MDLGYGNGISFTGGGFAVFSTNEIKFTPKIGNKETVTFSLDAIRSKKFLISFKVSTNQ